MKLSMAGLQDEALAVEAFSACFEGFTWTSRFLLRKPHRFGIGCIMYIPSQPYLLSPHPIRFAFRTLRP